MRIDSDISLLVQLLSMSDCLEVSRLTLLSLAEFFRSFVELTSDRSILTRSQTLQHDEPGLLTIVREHETVPNGFGRLGTTV